MPKIIFDISMIGVCMTDKHHQTGVFRVIDNIVQKLFNEKNESQTLNIRFYATMHANEIETYFAEKSTIVRQKIYLEPISKFENIKNTIRSKEKRINDRIINTQIKLLKYVYKLQNLVLYKIRLSLIPLLEYFFYREINLFQADIFHSPFFPIPYRFLKDKSIKRFLTVYDLIPILQPEYFIGQPVPIKQAIDRMHKDDFFFTISQSTKNDLCNYRKDINPDHVFVTHLAADKSLFYQVTDKLMIKLVKEKYNIPDEPYFLSLSTLEPRKNIEQVIRSFAKLITEGRVKNINLVLVGKKGWQFDNIFNTLEEWAFAKPNVYFTGFVDNEDLAALYSGAMSFVYVSHYEGFGLPPLEAMQCGVPTITSNNSSLPEVVGDAAIMVDSKDENALCDAMYSLYNDSCLRAEFSEKATIQASKFSWEKCVQQMKAGYQAALKGH